MLREANALDLDLLVVPHREAYICQMRDERLGRTELTSPDIEEVADLLLTRAGTADYFDRLIYATAASRGSALLTEDEGLAEGSPERRPASS